MLCADTQRPYNKKSGSTTRQLDSRITRPQRVTVTAEVPNILISAAALRNNAGPSEGFFNGRRTTLGVILNATGRYRSATLCEHTDRIYIHIEPLCEVIMTSQNPSRDLCDYKLLSRCFLSLPSVTMTDNKPVILPKTGMARVRSVMSGDTIVLWSKAAAPNLEPPQVVFTFEGITAPRYVP